MKNLKIIILAIILIFLTIINTNFLSFFWLPQIEAIYEFPKVLAFNILIPIFSIFFLLKNFKKRVFIPKIIFIIFILFVFSLFSVAYPLTNIFWNNQNWHWLIMMSNLVILYWILLNFEKNKIEKLLKYILILSPIIFSIAICEFIFWSEYWVNIWFFNFASSFSLFSIMITPFILRRISFLTSNNHQLKAKFLEIWNFKINETKISKYFYIFIFIIISICLFLTKLILPILIYLGYIYYFTIKNVEKKFHKNILFFLWVLIFFTILIIFNTWLKEEISNFISKILSWQSTYDAIAKNVSSTFFWVWNDSLIFTFENSKSKLLYIFENIWYKINKPNNFFLEIFYWFGVLGIVILFNCLHNFYLWYKKESIFHHIILIFLTFSMLNTASIINYFFLIIIIAYISTKNEKENFFIKTKIFVIIFSIFSIFTNIIYFGNEVKYYKNLDYSKANIVYKKLKHEDKENYILNSNEDIFKKCEKLLAFNKSAETFFSCWNFFWEIWYKDLAKVYYNKGLEKLPDMRNKDSNFYKNFFIKYLFNKNKFFDQNKSNLIDILNVTWKKITIDNMNKYLIFDLDWTLIDQNKKFYPNLVKKIKELSKNYKLFLTTNSSAETAIKLLKDKGIYENFEYILGWDNLKKSKEHIIYFKDLSLDENFKKYAVYFWDSELDENIAKEAEIKFILVKNWNILEKLKEI